MEALAVLLKETGKRDSMTEADIEIILQWAKEQYPPRVISDNSPQFIAKDFKEFIRVWGMTHVRTSPTIPNRTEKSNVGTNRSKENGRQRDIHAERDRKLEQARKQRQVRRQQAP